MRIKILTDTKEQSYQAIRCADYPNEDIVSYYNSILQDAYDKQIETLYLQGIPLQEKNSDNFQIMGNMERTIVNFLKAHEFPKNVAIVADCDEAATMFKVVYNFWFAEEKSNRMTDEHWD